MNPRPLTAALSLSILGALLSFTPLQAQDKTPAKGQAAKSDKASKIDKPAQKEVKSSTPASVTKDASVTIDGKKIDYTVTASKLILKKEDGTPRASIFHISYLQKNVSDTSTRPVLFAFNGGPGSSSVWLHLGGIGPRIVPSSPDGTKALTPPYEVTENPLSILDVADLVFIDPVSTGYSRPEKDSKKSEFHGLDEDIASVADFIRRWVSENKRWNSPKYLLGESYGGIRAAGLAQHLQSNYGMNLNGVCLLSSLLDYRSLRAAQGDDLQSTIFLPSYTAVAHHFKKITGNRDQLVAQAHEFANGPYAMLLLKGTRITQAERQATAERLSQFTGISAEIYLENNLRLSPSRFRKELLRSEGKVLGRFDARVSLPSSYPSSDYPSFDPSYSTVYGVFSTAMLDYLTRDLGWKEDNPYHILTSKVHPWNWGPKNSIINVSPRLAEALRDNPKMKVLIQCGHSDLATPHSSIRHSIDHLFQIPAEQRDNIKFAWYESGHMFYLNEPDLKKMRTDLVDFITK